MKITRNLFLKIFFFSWIIFNLIIDLAYGKDFIMPLTEIKPAMKGIGKTVFKGTKIEDFQVEIIDIIKGEGDIAHYILAHLSGEKMEASGGISEGMSGSPVYIDDRLIGAISYSWEMSEHNYCLLTPIEEMLKLFNIPPSTHHSTVSSPRFTSSSIGKDIQNNPLFIPASSILVTGLSNRSFQLLSNHFRNYNLRTIQGVEMLEGIDLQEVGELPGQKIKAGSAIGIQLSRGDVNIMAIGTVTYREGNKIIALGHPFLKKGEVSFLLSSVYIYHSLPNMIMSFKLGAPINLIGKVTQDRAAGILGEINSFPSIIPLKVRVNNMDTSSTLTMGVQLVNDYSLLEPLVSTITLQAIDNNLDRIGPGTAQVRVEVKGRGEGQYLIRENMFYDVRDIAWKAVSELPQIITAVVDNYFEEVIIDQINLDIQIEQEKRVGRLEEVKLEKTTLKPGDDLKALIKVRPFRQDILEKTLIIKLPRNMPSGEAWLYISGGGDAFSLSEITISGKDQEKTYKNLSAFLEDIEERPKGNQIIGEIAYSLEEDNSLREVEKTGGLSSKKDEERILVKIDTDLVIEGYFEVPFYVK